MLPQPHVRNTRRLSHAHGLASSAFARHYSRNHNCFLFLRVLRCFTSPRSLQNPMCSGTGNWPLNASWVSPFGHPRITARLTAPRGLSRPPTSFIGSWCQGIHRAPLKTWPQMLASTVQFSNNDQPPITPELHSEFTGAGIEGVHSLRHPTACPAHSPLPSTFHAPKSCTRRRRRSSVPNNQRSTHEQPPQNVCLRSGL